MQLKLLEQTFSVCKVADISDIDFSAEFCFVGKTDEELSLVCASQNVPANAAQCVHGWKAFKIQGALDFSLIGILAKISGLLAEAQVSIFAVSTYNTDYFLVKAENLDSAVNALRGGGYTIE